MRQATEDLAAVALFVRFHQDEGAHSHAMLSKVSYIAWTSVRNSVHTSTQPGTNASCDCKVEEQERKWAVLGNSELWALHSIVCKPRATSTNEVSLTAPQS